MSLAGKGFMSSGLAHVYGIPDIKNILWPSPVIYLLLSVQFIWSSSGDWGREGVGLLVELPNYEPMDFLMEPSCVERGQLTSSLCIDNKIVIENT